MQFKKEYLKNQVRKLAKQTWAGPGKFGVFIVICIIIIATFETLGLTNRENVLEMRNVQKVVIPVNYVIEEKSVKKEEISFDIIDTMKKQIVMDHSNKKAMHEKIIFYGALEQLQYEINSGKGNGVRSNYEKYADVIGLFPSDAIVGKYISKNMTEKSNEQGLNDEFYSDV